ncbi:class I SAM-dependent methyltransferase [Prauserella halophila]|uniref:class I SAM-dependent methyltransferase n=1 Tax=Prauserella halophila TaxID=185641 RepID=UPI003FD85DB4
MRRFWDKQSGRYDRQMRFWELRLLRDTRTWLCGRATGEVLEVAIGTGLNLSSYPSGVTVHGIDLSPGMLKQARSRAEELGLDVDVAEGNAQRLEFPDASFDTVVCTLSLCSVPDDRAVVAEMWRVLRPGGRLLLADHVVSTSAPLRVVQRLLELVTVPMGEEHFRRRPFDHVRAQGFSIEDHDRFNRGIVERLIARKPEH